MCSKPSKLTQQQFINRAVSIHGNKYDYSKVTYKTLTSKVKIVCKVHGIFEQTPKNHLKGQNCPVCSNRNKFTNEDFVKRARKIHKNKYDYSEINYVDMHTKIKIKCNEHGYFFQLPINHLKGNQCYKCSNKIKTT